MIKLHFHCGAALTDSRDKNSQERVISCKSCVCMYVYNYIDPKCKNGGEVDACITVCHLSSSSFYVLCVPRYSRSGKS